MNTSLMCNSKLTSNPPSRDINMMKILGFFFFFSLLFLIQDMRRTFSLHKPRTTNFDALQGLRYATLQSKSPAHESFVLLKGRQAVG